MSNGWRLDFERGQFISDTPKKSLKYEPLSGIVSVSRDQQTVDVLPHLVLEEFLAKQKSKFPKYLGGQERLLLKLKSRREHEHQYKNPVQSL